MKSLRLLTFLFLLSFGGTLLVLGALSPAEPPSGGTRIEIASGATVRDIAETLKREDVIRSALLFRFYLQWHGLDRALKSGVFLIPARAGFAEIGSILIGGNGKEVAVTIPEGFTVTQIDALLAEMGVIASGDILSCARECDFSSFAFLPEVLEGYLFPDTYYVSIADFVPKFFLGRLLGTFRERVVDGLGSDITVSERSLHDILTMASLIERETRTAEERPIISGILWKRFDSGRALDVDATIRYALGKTTEPLTKDDLEVDSPYNTRRYAGLPPGPIANPGLESIRAALHPEDSPYWYYLHGKDGKIHYSETNDEHNEKKARYL